MSIKVVMVDAFTDKTFAGNPAAVCLLDQPAETAWMQSVAREMNLPATAFIQQQRDHFDLRWFSAAAELEFCGHGTLASAHALGAMDLLAPGSTVRFSTRRGDLAATNKGDRWIELDLPAEAVEPVTEIPKALIEALKITPKFVGKGRLDYLVVVDSPDQVKALQPDFEMLKTVQTRGVSVTSQDASGQFDFVSRFFCPSVGVNEDPVTGSAHCALGPFWHKELGKSDLLAYQASARGGLLRMRIAGDRVYLSGQAVTVLKGELC
jgi:PhzF family phenazine biosynthesis protein